MSAQQRLKRIFRQQNFQPNGVLSFSELPRNYDNECYGIRIRGTATLPVALPAGSNTFKPALRSDAPAGLIPRVELTLEGRQTLISCPWHVLNRANMWRARQPYFPEYVETYGATQNPGLVRNAATASSVLVENTAITFESTVFLDNALLQGMRSKDSNLRTGGLQTLEIKLTCADSASLFYQPQATLLTTPFSPPAIGATLAANLSTVVVLSNVVVEVFIVELQELVLPGEKLSIPGYARRWSNQTVPISAAQSNLEIQLPTDNFLQAVIISPKIGGESSDIIVNKVTVRRGTDQRIELPIRDLIALNERDYRHPRFPGYYIADFMGNGGIYDKIADAWNLQGGADVRLVLDVQNPGANVTCDVTSLELLPLMTGG